MHHLNRSQKLKIACTAAGTSVSGFAKKTGVTETAIRRAAIEEGFPRLKKEIDRFITEQFKKMNMIDPVNRAA